MDWFLQVKGSSDLERAADGVQMVKTSVRFRRCEMVEYFEVIDKIKSEPS
jgi:hypothetical protein